MTEEKLFLITEKDVEKLRWNYGSASPAAIELEPVIRSHPYNPQAERGKILKTIIEWREKQPTNRCREMSDWCDIWFDEDAFLEKLREGKDGEHE